MNKRLNFNNCYVLGPTGPKGSDGDKILISKTTTLDEDMSAEVIDRVDGNIHNLEFRIPRGKSGTSNNPTYGYKFSDVGTTYDLEVLQGKPISLNRISDFKNIITDIEDEFVIINRGIYKIEYFFSGHASEDTALFVGVSQNGEILDGTEISKDVIKNTDTDFYGVTLAELNENDSITLSLKSRKKTEVTSAPDINAYVIIIKIA